MLWRAIVAFLIGCVIGAVALYVYLQAAGKILLERSAAVAARREPLPAQPAGVAPPVAGTAIPRANPLTARIEPKPLATPGPAPLTASPMAIPVAGVEKPALRDHFDQVRGGTRRHEALDIMAPRGTPVLAAVDGKIVRLFSSVPGGLTIYQTDIAEKLIYYYAHLDRYAGDLFQGKAVLRGEVIGYVGSTGNAPEDAPHLHFAIMRTTNPKEWWKGEPINPYPLLMQNGVSYHVPER